MKKRVRWAALCSATLLATMGITGCNAEKTPASSGQVSREESGYPDLQQKEIVFAGLPGFWMPEDENAENYDEMAAFKEEVETLFNCRLRFDSYSPWDVYFQKLQDMTMSGDVIGDVVAFDNYIYPKAMLTGILSPLQDYINVKDYALWEEAVEPYFDLNGDVYGVSPKLKSSLPSDWIAYNKTLFEEKGLAAKYNIQELVMNKQWTWEVFREIVKESTIDSNGDGTPDIWGLGGQGMQYGRLTNSLVRANGGTYTRKEGNTVKLTVDSPEFVQALEFMHTLTWQDKVISTDEAWRGYDTPALFAKGGCMFYGITNWWIQTLKSMTPEGTVIGVIPYPIGPSANGEYIKFSGAVTMYGMPSTSKNKAEAGAVFEYWMRNKPDQEKTVREAWSDMVYNTESLDVIEMLSKLPVTLELASTGYTALNNFILGEHGITEKIPPATFIEQIRDPIETEIAQMWALAQ